MIVPLIPAIFGLLHLCPSPIFSSSGVLGRAELLLPARLPGQLFLFPAQGWR